MKKMKFLPVLFIAGLCAFSACNNDDGNGEVFSDLTTEQHKAKLEEEGIIFAKNMEAVADLQMFDVVDAFLSFQEQENANVNPALAFGLDQVSALRNGPKTAVSLKSLALEKGSVSSEFEAKSGIYTWDGTGFVYSPKAGEITYIFPVGEKQVDATISITNFNVQTAATQNDPEFETELPLSVNMSVKLGETELCSYAFTGEWYENDTPKLLKEVITLEGFNFTHELSNNKATLSMGSSFKYNETVIVANNLTIEGNVDYSELMATIEAANSPEDAMGQDILTKANAWFQVGNVKAEGIVNVKGIMEGMEAGMQTVESEEALMALLVELANVNAQLYVRYADSNEIIAKSEFFLNTYEDERYTYNESTQSYELGMETVTEPDMRMIFADKSAVESDFFQTGFGDMITEIDALISRIEANFGEETTPVQ